MEATAAGCRDVMHLSTPGCPGATTRIPGCDVQYGPLRTTAHCAQLTCGRQGIPCALQHRALVVAVTDWSHHAGVVCYIFCLSRQIATYIHMLPRNVNVARGRVVAVATLSLSGSFLPRPFESLILFCGDTHCDPLFFTTHSSRDPSPFKTCILATSLRPYLISHQ